MLDSGGGGGGSQRTSSDGLILPSAFPAREHDLDTSKINGSANDLRAMGKSVRAQMGDIDSEWSGLRDHYEAPEQGRVYKLMDPAVESATDLKSTLRKAAGHLDTYASSLECIKPRLKDIEKRAWDFRNKVQGGVEVEKPQTPSSYRAAGVPNPSDDGGDTETVPWNEDEDTVAKNEALLKEYAGLLEEISNAASTCANDINALVEGKCVAKVEATPAEAFTNPQKPMPWGSPVAEDKTCGEQVGDAGKGWGKALAEGVGQSVLGYNPGSNPWDRDSYTLKSAGQAWGGFGDLIRSTVVVPAAGYTQLGYKLTGHDDDEMPEWTTSKWMNDRADVMASGWGSMVGYDHEAAKAGDSGWQKWKDNPWEAGTETALNIGTAFIPGAGTAGAGAKAASTGGKVAKASKAGRVANGVADFVVPGGSWALKGGVTVRSKFKDLAAGMTPSAMKTFGKGDASPHKDLIDAVDDVPAKAPERSTPVSDTTFGGDRTPAGEPGPSPSSSPVAPDGQPSSGVPESSGAGRAEGAEPGQPVGRDGVAEPGSGTGKTTAAGDRSPAPVESPEARDAASTGAPAARAGADGSGSAGAPESPVPARADGGESPAPAGRDGVGGSGPGASPAAGAGAAGRGVPEQPVASGAADRAPAGGERPSGDGAESPASAGRDGAGRSGPGASPAAGGGAAGRGLPEQPAASHAADRAPGGGERPSGDGAESPASAGRDGAGRSGRGASPATGVGAAGRGVPEQPVATGAADQAPAGSERPSSDGPSEGGSQQKGSSHRPGRPVAGDGVPAGVPESPVPVRAGGGESPSPAGLDGADAPEARASKTTGAGDRRPEQVGTGQAPDSGSPAVRPEEPLSGEGKSPDVAEPSSPAEGATSESGALRGAEQAGTRMADAGSSTMPEKWQPPAVDNHVDFGEIGPRTTFPPKGVELEPNSAYDVAGRGTYYTDPTGRVNHVVTDYGPSSTPNADLNNPAPDTTYVVGDKHVFVTDHKARTSEVHIPNLERGDAARSGSIQSSVGRAAGPGHDGGHLIANAMGGGRERVNIVAMLEELNRSGSGQYGRASNSFYKFEKSLLTAADSGADVSLDLYVTYGESRTPSKLQAEATIDGNPLDWKGNNVRR